MQSKWKTTSLEELGVQLIDCDHKTPKAVEGGVPYIGIPQMDNGRINFEAKPRLISEKDFITWTRKANPKYGDVILSRRCNSGETVYVPKGAKFALGQNLVLLRPNGERLHPEYLRWVVQGTEWWNEVAKYLNPGAIFESLKCRDIPKFKIPEPPKRHQIKISEVLSSISEKIELNQQTNQTLEQMAQTLFKSWFVDFDPVFDNLLAKADFKLENLASDFPEALLKRAQKRLLALDDKAKTALLSANSAHRSQSSEETSQTNIHQYFPSEFEHNEQLGWIPKGWQESNVGSEFDVTMGQSPPGSTYNEINEGIPFFQGKTDYGFRFPSNRIYCTAPKRLANKNDTLVSVRAPVGTINLAAEKCAIGRGLAAVRHKSGSISFTYYAMNDLAKHFAVFEGEGTVFGSINQKDFNALPQLSIPAVLANLFNQFCSSWDEKIELTSLQINELTKLRDTLLPKLISGELQISKAYS